LIPTTIAEQRDICPQITVPDEPSNKMITISQKLIIEDLPPLGCLKTMICDDTANGTKLKKKNDSIGVRVKNGKLNHKQGWMALNGMFFPSMKYSLPDQQYIDFIQNYTVVKLISAIGYDHSMHRSIVFGLQEFGGIRIKYQFTEMMSMKLNSIMSHLRSNDKFPHRNYVEVSLDAGTEEIYQLSGTQDKYSSGTSTCILCRRLLRRPNKKTRVQKLITKQI
jgi:hypothetical protein